MAEAAIFFTLTPREILLRLTAFRRARLRRQEELWLLGQYVALAVHAPAHLPPLPPGFGESAPMTDDEMKRRLLGWRGKDEA